MKNLFYLLIFSSWILAGCTTRASQTGLSDGPRRVEILFLGHDSQHHNSEKLMPMLALPLFQKGINLTYTSDPNDLRSEEHTSELQSRPHLVCRLLLEKKNK